MTVPWSSGDPVLTFILSLLLPKRMKSAWAGYSSKQPQTLNSVPPDCTCNYRVVNKCCLPKMHYFTIWTNFLLPKGLKSSKDSWCSVKHVTVIRPLTGNYGFWKIVSIFQTCNGNSFYNKCNILTQHFKLRSFGYHLQLHFDTYMAARMLNHINSFSELE